MAFSMADAVNKILKIVDDPDGQTYCDTPLGSNYDGRAKDAFWESVVDLLLAMFSNIDTDKPSLSVGLDDNDIWGLIENANAPTATGKILFSSLDDFYRFRDIFINPDAPNPLKLNLVKTNRKFISGLRGIDFIRDEDLLWYQSGDGITFVPQSKIDLVFNNVQVEYVKQPDIASYQNASGGDTKDLTLLFSLPFIYKAIQVAAGKINNEKNTN